MKQKARILCAVVLAAYLLFGVVFYFVNGDSLHKTTITTDTVSASMTLGDLPTAQEMLQPFVCPNDTLDEITLSVFTHASTAGTVVKADILEPSGVSVLNAPVLLDADEMEDHSPYRIQLPEPIRSAKGKTMILRLYTEEGNILNAVSPWCGNSVSTGRFDLSVEISDTDALVIDGTPLRDQDGNLQKLCMTITGTDFHWFGQYYWYVYGGGALLVMLYLAYVLFCHKHKRKCATITIYHAVVRYNFLIRQLVARDFKTKYKRSVLGVLWSFLNPLLTMSIQYLIFSTIFQSTIPNFVIYLLSGIVCFNFFSEATGMCLMSIVGNTTLINKVYVPKFIYPLSRTLSSGINLLLSLIPLLLMLPITKTPITPAILMLPLIFLMLFMLSYGVGLLLATMMVFFRDTQFLWNIFSMLLMYMTPIFYPESIIPARFMAVYKLNPLYHILRFVRSILIDGVTLEPKAYLFCFLLCFIPFLLGIVVFRKNEKKFVLNI